MTIRHRKRVENVSPSGSTLLGYCQNRNPASGIVSPIQHSHQYYLLTSQNPYHTGEFCRDETHPGPPYKSGGDFKCVKVTSCLPMSAVHGSGVYFRPDGEMVYTGGFNQPSNVSFGTDLVIAPSSAVLTETSFLFPTMTGLGNRAWNATKPHLEKAGASVFLAELRDLPQMLKTSSGYFHDMWKQTQVVSTSNVGVNPAYAMTPKKAADHFINHNFGWAPFVNDLSKFYDTMSRMDEHIARLSRQNGRYVRRRVSLQGETVTTLKASGTGCKVFPNSSFDHDTRWNRSTTWFVGTGASWELYDILKEDIYGVGKFYFYRPEFDRTMGDYAGVFKTLQRRATLLGLRINPSNIYKATPWSWAIDWVSNLGDHIDHLNDILSDSIACQYAYVMRHTTRTRRFIQKLPFANGTVTLTFDRLVDTKQRLGALSPYGFDLSFEDLSWKQIAIAGALGISRSSVAR